MSASAAALTRTSETVGRIPPSGVRCPRSSRRRSTPPLSADIAIWNAGAHPPPVRGPPCRGSCRGALDVLGDDPPLGARALELRQVDAALLRDSPRERRRLHAA